MEPLFPEDGSPAPAPKKRRARAPAAPAPEAQAPAPEAQAPADAAPAQDLVAEARARLERASAALSERAQAYLAAHAEVEEAKRALYAAQFPPLPEGAQPPFHELHRRASALSKLGGPRPRPRRKPSPQLWRGKA